MDFHKLNDPYFGEPMLKTLPFFSTQTKRLIVFKYILDRTAPSFVFRKETCTSFSYLTVPKMNLRGNCDRNLKKKLDDGHKIIV